MTVHTECHDPLGQVSLHFAEVPKGLVSSSATFPQGVLKLGSELGNLGLRMTSSHEFSRSGFFADFAGPSVNPRVNPCVNPRSAYLVLDIAPTDSGEHIPSVHTLYTQQDFSKLPASFFPCSNLLKPACSCAY